MRKFECNECGANCKVFVDDLTPKYCLYDKEDIDWHEVKEDTTQQFGNSEQLPDWCKVGKWGYDTKTNDYFEIVSINSLFVNVNLFNGGYLQHGYGIIRQHCVEARKRPFNADEMRALVGEVVEHKNNLHLVTNYLEESTDNTPYVCVGTNWREAKGLIEHGYTIDGKPCFKLEHLNDKGEWIE